MEKKNDKQKKQLEVRVFKVEWHARAKSLPAQRQILSSEHNPRQIYRPVIEGDRGQPGGVMNSEMKGTFDY